MSSQDILSGSGLTIEALLDLVNSLSSSLQAIYGTDINLLSNSPDGQMVNIYSQGGIDLRELISSTYNSFNPDRATGVILDERCAINGVIRQGGTYTIIPVDIVATQVVTLSGLDTDYNNPQGVGYTISDNAGNLFILINTTTLSIGTQTLDFRAQNIGAVTVSTNTVNSQVTPVLGVSSVNNSLSALSVGIDQETDQDLRQRRSISTNNSATGYIESIKGNIASVSGVTEEEVYENKTNDTDINGIPGHAVWAIVEGGYDLDIADAMYNTVGSGGTYGSTTINIVTNEGQSIPISFSRPVPVILYIKFNLKKIVPSLIPNITGIENYITDNLNFGIGQYADQATLTALATTAVQTLSPGALVLDLQISLDGSTWTDYIEAPTLASQFITGNSYINITEE